MWASRDLSPGSVGWRAILVAIGALIFGGILAYHALSNEVTGMATYRTYGGRIGRGTVRSEKVTREDSPLKFREATNFIWGLSGFCLVVSVASFWFYRKIDEDLDEYF